MRHDYNHDDDYDDPRHEPPPSGWCAECGKSCTAKMVDCGIGAYEFWGHRGTHHDWQCVSSCCEADFLETPDESEDDA